MYERRLRIFFGMLAIIALVVIGRAMQFQIFQRKDWQEKAAQSLKRHTLIDTTRGRILDYKGRELAADIACVDAAVDYRAIVKDADWIKGKARQRLRVRGDSSGDRKARVQRLDDEIKAVSTDIDNMWPVLARLGGKTLDDIELIRSDIVRRVELRRRAIWYNNYRLALQKRGQQPPAPWYQRWLVNEQESGPQLDQFAVTVKEQISTHSILRGISTDVYNELDKRLDSYPGLELKRSTHRVYREPGNYCAAHVLGRESAVTREDMEADPNLAQDDLRRYYPSDLIGRTGLEALAEPLLRGSMGRQEQSLGGDAVELVKPVPGQDVRTSIDVELQTAIMHSFQKLKLRRPDETRDNLHGAAVVIDVPTGEIRALVSYPTFDLNRLEADYNKLLNDEINRPLMNRATEAQYEPGSSVKTIIGSVAASRGVVGINEGIECTGYLTLPDHHTGRNTVFKAIGRCWTARQFEGIADFRHHQIPTNGPHRGHDGNADGFLTLSDAIERSCNVYFETVADRMGLYQVAEAMHLYGLGQPTGLGIAEASGRIPRGAPDWQARMVTCFAGIGQGQVLATPVQMANVAATIARGGIWLRPRLLCQGAMAAMKNVPGGGERSATSRAAASRPTTAGGSHPFRQFTFAARTGDRFDLQLSSSAMAAVKFGMIQVVNSDGGTGDEPRRSDMIVAGKTGSAQAPKFSIHLKDQAGNDLRDANGHVMRQTFEPGAFGWYQGVGDNHDKLAHAWYIGFAPADNPKVAFAVLVEYGGQGGRVAGRIVGELLDACVEAGYLRGNPR